MITKYERAKAAAEQRARHEANIKVLQGRIREAKDILSVIPNIDFENIRERNTVRAELKRLSEFLADEERAYKATFEDEETAESVVSYLGL